jgi:tetratricopeptide (TPR) repeat protein
MSDKVRGLAPEHSVAYPPEHLVGRRGEQETICRAIQEGARIVYIEGGGGIGKTRLLDEVGRFVHNLPHSPIVLDIVDFYDTAMHGSLALEETLARQMRRRAGDGGTIDTFISALERYRVGAIDEKEVHTAFTQAFNTWVGDQWAVLRFDTAEFLEYGQDVPEVLEECEVSGEESPAVRWLENWLSRLERATALIAARPTRTLYRQLESAYSKDLWVSVPLEALSLDETGQYFRASEYGREIEEEMVERVWLLTNGRPILLSLAIDWLVRGVRVDEIYDADIRELRDLKKRQGQEWEEHRRRFEEALIGKVRLLSTPLDAAIYYAARARKGFTAEMLGRMLKELSPRQIELPPQETNTLVESLSKLSFVKHPYGARPGWYFLHDEMYDLVDRYVWETDYPGYLHQAETARFLAEQIYGDEYGEGLIAQAAKQLRMAETYVDLFKARRHLDILRTEQLFYWLEADPADGYRRYERLDTQAISQRNREWDDMLRIEVLRFIHTLPGRARDGNLVEGRDPRSGDWLIADSVNRDSRAHWVHRFFARENEAKAERIACCLVDAHPDWGGFWKARILITRGAALVRMGRAESVEVLGKALEILEQPQVAGDRWAIRHQTATAYLYLGLQARAGWNLEQAVENYGKARELFDQNGEPIAAARALNNLAYILVKQGKYQQAVSDAQEASVIRDQSGDIVGMALSSNTIAIAEDRAGMHMRAWGHAWEALKQLQQAKQVGYPGRDREIAMVHINLGRIRRHKARRERPQLEDRVESDWRRSEDHLRKAKDLERSLEPYYRFDLYNQFGLLYSNWANWIATRRSGEEAKGRFHGLMDLASKHFEEADRFAEEHHLPVDQADNLEDWAWVFHLRCAYREDMGDDLDPSALKKEVFDRLARAEQLALGSVTDPKLRGLQAYYILGSLHHQRGRYVHKFEDDQGEALRQYALSMAYYDQFSLNPVDPLERRERVREHVLSLFESTSIDQAKQMIRTMVGAVESRQLLSTALRRWLEDVVAYLY